MVLPSLFLLLYLLICFSLSLSLSLCSQLCSILSYSQGVCLLVAWLLSIQSMGFQRHPGLCNVSGIFRCCGSVQLFLNLSGCPSSFDKTGPQQNFFGHFPNVHQILSQHAGKQLQWCPIPFSDLDHVLLPNKAASKIWPAVPNLETSQQQTFWAYPPSPTHQFSTARKPPFKKRVQKCPSCLILRSKVCDNPTWQLRGAKYSTASDRSAFTCPAWSVQGTRNPLDSSHQAVFSSWLQSYTRI